MTTDTMTLKDAWGLIHPLVTYRVPVRTGHAIAHFDTAVELTDGRVVVKGTVVDEYGWWHSGFTVEAHDFDKAGFDAPQEAPFPVGVNFEWRRGLIRLTIPDDAASRLRIWRNEHWHEFYGYNDGYTDTARRGTWEHKALAYLHSVQSHLTDNMPFIEGESFASMRNEHGHALPGAYDIFVSTSGVRANVAKPNCGFHFAG